MSCFVCERLTEIRAGENPDLIIELESSYVVLGDFQFFRGYTLLLAKEHKEELHELDSTQRTKFLAEMALVAEALYAVVQPAKMNYELLGNRVRHLHWHLFPRHADDPRPQGPVFLIDEAVRNAESTRGTSEDRDQLKREIRAAIENIRMKRT